MRIWTGRTPDLPQIFGGRVIIKSSWCHNIGCWLIALVAIGGSLCACGSKSVDNQFFIRIGDSTITVLEFKHAVAAAAEEAFPGEREIPVAVRNDLYMRVLNQLTEELLITEYSRTVGLQITEAELDQAVAAIKADYPDNTFEETLLENAVSFQSWRQKLARRLLVEKVIAKELVDQVMINSDDVDAYYQAHYPEGPSEDESAEQINMKIVRHLRQQKAEQMYQGWIEKLRKAHPVMINQNQWDRLAEVH